MKVGVCEGFGEFENKCNRVVTHMYWCKRCDNLRRIHMEKRLDEVTKVLEELNEKENE